MDAISAACWVVSLVGTMVDRMVGAMADLKAFGTVAEMDEAMVVCSVYVSAVEWVV